AAASPARWTGVPTARTDPRTPPTKLPVPRPQSFGSDVADDPTAPLPRNSHKKTAQPSVHPYRASKPSDSPPAKSENHTTQHRARLFPQPASRLRKNYHFLALKVASSPRWKEISPLRVPSSSSRAMPSPQTSSIASD